MKIRYIASVACAAIASLLVSDVAPALATESLTAPVTAESTASTTPVPAETPAPPESTTAESASTPTPTPTDSETPTPAPTNGTTPYPVENSAPWNTPPLSVSPRDVIIQAPQGTLPALQSALKIAGISTEFTYTKALNGVAVTASNYQIAALKQAVPGLVISDQIEYKISDTVSNAPWNLSMLDDATFPPNNTYSYPPSAGQDVKVYVIDTGVKPNSAQFGTRLAAGADFTGSGTSSDCNGHGTHVAGTVGSASYGVAKKVTIVPLHALAPANNCSSGGSNSNVIAAINWAINDNPAGKRAVINMSLGPSVPTLRDSAMDAAIANAINDGIVVVVAAGNSGRQARFLPLTSPEACDYSPANSPGVLAVGAVDTNGDEADFSNYGSCVSIFAPGVAVRSLDYNNVNGYSDLNGTSMATPHVAGAVALYIADNPTKTANQAKQAILDSALTNAVGFYPGHSNSPNLMLNISAFTQPTLTNTTPVAVTVSGGTPAGKPKVGSTIAATAGAWTSTVSVRKSYEWYTCTTEAVASSATLPNDCVLVDNEVGSNLTVTAAMAYKHILTAETATASNTTETIYSATQGPVALAPTATSDPEVSGTASVGETLSVTDGIWDASPAPTFTYRWYACATSVVSAANSLDSSKACAVIPNAVAATFVLTSAQLNKYVIAEVRALNEAVANPVSRFTSGVNQVTQAPVNTVAPAVTITTNPGADGKPRFAGGVLNSKLSLSNGTWTGTAPITFEYRWYSCLSVLAAASTLDQDCTEISGQRASTYIVTASDVGRTVLGAVLAVNPISVNATVAYSASTALVGQPPQNLFPASISSSGVRVGDTLTGDDGTWDSADALTRQWFICSAATSAGQGAPTTAPSSCVAITGATSATLLLTSAHTGKFIVFESRATNASGGATLVKSSTASTVAVTAAPVNTVSPAITASGPLGTNSVPKFASTGSTLLSLSRGTWTGTATITYSYEWYRCDSSIVATRVAPGGCSEITTAPNATTYTVTAADEGKFITGAVIATNSAGESVKFSTSTAAVATLPANSANPSLGNVEPFVGNALTVSDGTWSGSPAPRFTYQWYSCSTVIASAGATQPAGCVVITGATSARYVIPATLSGKYFVARVIATNQAGAAPARFSASTMSAAKTGPLVTVATPGTNGAPRFTGIASTSSLLTVSKGLWDGTGTTYQYSWYSCDESASGSSTEPDGCSLIAGAQASTLRITSAQVGLFIVGAVTATNSLGVRTSWSPSTAQVTSPPVNTVAPSVTGSAYVGRTVTALPGTWTGTPSPTFSYKWYSCSSVVASSPSAMPTTCALITGATSSTYVVASTQANKFLVVAVNALNGAIASPGVLKISPSSSRVLIEPTNSSAARVSSSSSAGASPIVGSRLTAVRGTWTGSPTLTYGYQWFTCSSAVTATSSTKPDQCASIDGAASSTFTVTDDLVDTFITVAETATNPASSKTLFSIVTAKVVSRPSRQSDPTLDGTAVAGELLIASPGTVTATPVASTALAWFACPTEFSATSAMPSGCLQRTGTTTNYVITSADAGLYLTVRESATNVAGSDVRFSASTTIVKSAPVSVVGPQVTVSSAAANGAPRVGGSMTSTVGTWNGYPVPSTQSQWVRCSTRVVSVVTEVPADCTEILGATDISYVPDVDDVGHFLSVVVTAQNELGQSVRVAPSTGSATVEAPSAEVDPSLSTARTVGQTITLTAGQWRGTPSPTLVNSWYRCSAVVPAAVSILPVGCVLISDAAATASTRTLTTADLGKFIVSGVKASSAAGTATRYTASSASIASLPTVTAAPTIAGKPWVGKTLTATTGTFAGTPTPQKVFTWYSCDAAYPAGTQQLPDGCSAIAVEAGSMIIVPDLLDSQFIMFEVTATNDAGSVTSRSATTTNVRHIPVNTASPALTGSPIAGRSIITTTQGSWTGSAPLAYAFSWYACSTRQVTNSNTLPAGCAVIAGQSSAQFAPVAAQVGKYVLSGVTVTNQTESVTQYSASTTIVAADPLYVSGMAVTVPSPATGGAPRAGYDVVAAPGTWSGTPAPTFTYQWYLCEAVRLTTASSIPDGCDVIPVTTARLTITADMAGLFPLVRITGSNTAGTLDVFSPTTTKAVTVPPAETLVPSLSGNPYVFATLVADPGVWTGSPTPSLAYAWYSCLTPVEAATTSVPSDCVKIANEITAKLKLSAAMKTKNIAVLVTATNIAGSKSILTMSRGPITTGAVNTAPPTLSTTGVARVSGTMTLSRGTWVGDPAPVAADDEYQWYRCPEAVPSSVEVVPETCFEIFDATLNTYTLTDDDADMFILGIVTAQNSNGASTVTTKSTARVMVPPANTVSPVVSGRPFARTQLTTDDGTWTGIPEPSVTYQWQACIEAHAASRTQQPANCTDIPNATAANFTPGDDEIGDYILVKVTGHNDAGHTPTWSATTDVIASGPVNKIAAVVTVANGSSTGQPLVGGSLRTTGGTWIGRPTPVKTYQWMRCDSTVTTPSSLPPAASANCSDIADATSDAYPLVAADRGKMILVKVTGTNESGSVDHYSATSAAVTMVPVIQVAPTVGGVVFMQGTARAKSDQWQAFPAITRTYAWYVCDAPVDSPAATAPAGCALVSGAEAVTYTVPTSQAGKYLITKVTATNSVGSAVHFSATSSQIVAGPVNLIDPVINGKAQVGKPALTVSDGNWTPQGVELSYQWYRCAAETSSAVDELDPDKSCVELLGETSAVHNIVAADAGSTLIAGVTGLNDLGESTRFSKSTLLVTEFPSITTDPSISGLPEVEGTLTLNPGVWRGFPTPTISYSNWFACTARVVVASTVKPAACVEIPGAKGATFSPSGPDSAGKGGQIGKYIVYGVTKFNTIDGVKTAVTRYTASTDLVSQPASLTAKPFIKVYKVYGTLTKTLRASDQNPQVGDTLEISAPWKDPQPIKTYQWLRCDDRVAVAERIKDTAPPGCSVIAGATGTTYAPTADDTTKFIVASALGENSVGLTQEFTNSTIMVQQPPTNTVLPTVSGTRLKNNLLTANPGEWSGSPAPTISYQWYSCTAPVPTATETIPSTCVGNGETGTSYVQSATGLDDGKYITVRVVASNNAGTKSYLAAVTSNEATASAPVKSEMPTIELTTIDSGFVVGTTLRELSASWTSKPESTKSYVWYSCTARVTAAAATLDPSCSALQTNQTSGIAENEYRILSANLGAYILVGVTAENIAGQDTQYSASTPDRVTQTYVNDTPVGVSVVNDDLAITPSHPTVTITGQFGTWRDRNDAPVVSGGSGSPRLQHYWVFCETPIAAEVTYVPEQCETEPADSNSDINPTGDTLSADRQSWFVGMYVAYAEVVFEKVGTSWKRPHMRISATTARIMEAPSLWTELTGKNALGQTISLFSAPKVPAEMTVGTAVNATPGSWPATAPTPATYTTWRGTESGTFTYQWFSCGTAQTNYSTAGLAAGCSNIPGATSMAFAPTGDEQAKFLGVEVTAHNTLGTFTVWTATTLTGVTERPSNISAPAVTGDNIVGAVLTLSEGNWRGYPVPSKARTWYACTAAVASASNTLPAGCSQILSQRGATLTLTSDLAGKFIVGAVTASNSLTVAGQAVTAVKYTSSTGKIFERPVSLTAPVLSGTANVGSSLSMTSGTWKGTDTPVLTYRWFTCDTVPAANSTLENVASDCTLLAGRTANSLPLVAAFSGKYVVGQVKATNSATTASGVDGPRYRATTASPKVLEGVANVSAPTLSSEDTVDQTITASPGQWSGSPTITYSYSWFSCSSAVYAAVTTAPTAAPPTGAGCAIIAGATASTFKLTIAQVGKHVIAQVKASNTLNGSPAVVASATKTSVSNGPIRRAPVMSLAPTISGTMHVGQTASVNVGSWQGYPTPTHTYDWFTCPASVAVVSGSSSIPQTCTQLQNVSNQALVIPASAAGSRLVALITATNSAAPAGVAKSTATTLTVTSTPVNTAAPSISGASTLGNGSNTVRTSTGTWSGTPAPFGYAYAWYTCTSTVTADDVLPSGCTVIAGQTTASLILRTQYAGQYIVSKVTAKATVNKAGAGEASYISDSFGAVTSVPSTTSIPTMTGTAVSGSTLQANTGIWSGYTTPTITYDWYSCTSATTLSVPVTTAPATCTKITTSANSSLNLTDALAGRKILLMVTATNPSGVASKSSLLSPVVSLVSVARASSYTTTGVTAATLRGLAA